MAIVSGRSRYLFPADPGHAECPPPNKVKKRQEDHGWVFSSEGLAENKFKVSALLSRFVISGLVWLVRR